MQIERRGNDPSSLFLCSAIEWQPKSVLLFQLPKKHNFSNPEDWCLYPSDYGKNIDYSTNIYTEEFNNGEGH